MDIPWEGVIGVCYAAFGVYTISSPKRRERTAQAGADFQRALWGNVPGSNWFADIDIWRSLVWIIGTGFAALGLLIAADSFFGLNWFN